MKKGFILLALLTLAGCASDQVPRTLIRTPSGYVLEFPKDHEVEDIKVEVEKGVTRFSAKKIKARMNPEVIDSSSRAFVDGMKAAQDLVETGIKAGAKGVNPAQ